MHEASEIAKDRAVRAWRLECFHCISMVRPFILAGAQVGGSGSGKGGCTCQGSCVWYRRAQQGISKQQWLTGSRAGWAGGGGADTGLQEGGGAQSWNSMQNLLASREHVVSY